MSAQSSTRRADRAQSSVVGVALLLGVTVLALGGLTMGIGATVDANAAAADADRVADGLATGIQPVETTGVRRARLAFAGGTLRSVERDLRVLDRTGTIERVGVDALVYEHDGHRVVAVAGAVVRGHAAGAHMYREPPITASRGSGGVLVVGAPRLGAPGLGVSASGGTSVTLRTNVSHARTALPRDEYSVAIETETPAAWVAFFERAGATVVSRDRDLDTDDVSSVVARFPGVRDTYVVRHDLSLEVRP